MPKPDSHAVDAALPRPGDAWLPILLHQLELAGFGLWMLLGAALTLGLYRHGRSEVLVPLALASVFVGAGLIAALLRLPGAGRWHGWRPGRDTWPGGEALLALVSFLPALAVAGLAHGDNAFWATRLAGAALALCSLARLARLALGPRQHSARAFGSVIAASYSGGLWLCLCLTAQDAAIHPAGSHPWLMALILLALLLGFTEGVRWQALRGTSAGARPLRFVAATLTYALPCAALLVADRRDGSVLVVALAALSALLGLTLERRLYVRSLGALPA